MYAAGALRAIFAFLGFLLPALLIFLALTFLMRILRGRERKEAAKAADRIENLEREVSRLRLRLDARSATDAETRAPAPVLPAPDRALEGGASPQRAPQRD